MEWWLSSTCNVAPYFYAVYLQRSASLVFWVNNDDMRAQKVTRVPPPPGPFSILYVVYPCVTLCSLFLSKPPIAIHKLSLFLKPSHWFVRHACYIVFNTWIANLKVYSPSRVLALLFKLFNWNWPTRIKISKNTRGNYRKSCTTWVNSFVYFEIRDPCTSPRDPCSKPSISPWSTIHNT